MGIVSPLHKTDGLRLLVPSPILKPDALQSATPCSKPGQCGLDQYIVETCSTRQRAVLGIGQYMEERAVLGIGQYMEEGSTRHRAVYGGGEEGSRSSPRLHHWPPHNYHAPPTPHASTVHISGVLISPHTIPRKRNPYGPMDKFTTPPAPPSHFSTLRRRNQPI